MKSNAIGKEYPPVSYEVTREMILAYSHAVDETSPYFADEEAEVLYAPHTLVGAYTLLLMPHVVADKELGLDTTKRILHVHQEYEWKRTAVAGDVLTIRGRIADINSRDERKFIVFEGDIVDARGEQVVVARSTLMVG